MSDSHASEYEDDSPLGYGYFYKAAWYHIQQVVILTLQQSCCKLVCLWLEAVYYKSFFNCLPVREV
jgi:hypothetical protein